MIRNVHERVLAGTLDETGKLLDNLASEEDLLWPKEQWPAIKFDRALQVGAKGGHGPIRYSVAAYEPGRKINFRFSGSGGFDGGHWFELEEVGPDRIRLRHVLEMKVTNKARMKWLLIIRWLHDALIEDALDRAEAYASSRSVRQRQWSPWVRLLRAWMGRGRNKKRIEAVAVPGESLVAQAFPKIDYADAFRVKVPANKLPNVDAVSRAIFGSAPRWVVVLLGLRDGIMGKFGLKTSPPRRGRPLTFEPGNVAGIFKVFQHSENEILMGLDDRHLDFRVSVLLRQEGAERWATISTIVHFHNWLGRAYFVPVRPFHKLIVPAMIKRGLSSKN